jgi:hypothetical protein
MNNWYKCPACESWKLSDNWSKKYHEEKLEYIRMIRNCITAYRHEDKDFADSIMEDIEEWLKMKTDGDKM